MPNQLPTDEPKPLWAMEIGLGSLAFGSIELLVNQIGQALPVGKTAKAFARMTLSDRSTLLLETLEGSGHVWEVALRPLLVELDLHRPIRNTLAHEPLMLDVYVSESSQAMDVQARISSSREGGHTIRYEDLVHWRQRAQVIAQEMTRILYPRLGRS